jgi:hypothetical protein
MGAKGSEGQAGMIPFALEFSLPQGLGVACKSETSRAVPFVHWEKCLVKINFHVLCLMNDPSEIS